MLICNDSVESDGSRKKNEERALSLACSTLPETSIRHGIVVDARIGDAVVTPSGMMRRLMGNAMECCRVAVRIRWDGHSIVRNSSGTDQHFASVPAPLGLEPLPRSHDLLYARSWNGKNLFVRRMRDPLRFGMTRDASLSESDIVSHFRGHFRARKPEHGLR